MVLCAIDNLTKGAALVPSVALVDGGAGRTLKAPYLYGSVNEDFTAYGLLDHRHTPA